MILMLSCMSLYKYNLSFCLDKWIRFLSLMINMFYFIMLCHFSHVQLFVIPKDYSPSGSSVHRILQARTLEWVAISFLRVSSQPRDWNHISCIGGQILYFMRHYQVFSKLNEVFHIPAKNVPESQCYSTPIPAFSPAVGIVTFLKIEF